MESAKKSRELDLAKTKEVGELQGGKSRVESGNGEKPGDQLEQFPLNPTQVKNSVSVRV